MVGVSEFERCCEEAKEMTTPTRASLQYSISKLIRRLENYLHSEECTYTQEGPIAWLINELYRVKNEVLPDD